MRLKMILVGFKVFLAYKNSFIIEPFSEICIHNSVFRYNCNKFLPPTRFKIWIIRWYFEHAYAFLFRPTQNMATLNWEVNSRYSIYQKQFLAEVYAETYLSKKKKKNFTFNALYLIFGVPNELVSSFKFGTVVETMESAFPDYFFA